MRLLAVKMVLTNIYILRMFLFNFWRTIMLCFNDITVPMGPFSSHMETDLRVVLSLNGCTLVCGLPERTLKIQIGKRRFTIKREIFPSPSSLFIHLPFQQLWWDQFVQWSVLFNTFHPSRLLSPSPSRVMPSLCAMCLCSDSLFNPAHHVWFSPESKFGVQHVCAQKVATLSC